ncbi:MAG: response regulator [Planctomycetota bacterium]
MPVLIADNDRAVSGLLGEILKQAGLSVRFAYDGNEAERMAREPDVDAFVCDLDMPGATGVEVLEKLVDLPAPPPTVVASGFVDRGIEKRLRGLPFVREVLRKPFDLRLFSALVQRLSKSAGAGDDISPASES